MFSNDNIDFNFTENNHKFRSNDISISNSIPNVISSKVKNCYNVYNLFFQDGIKESLKENINLFNDFVEGFFFNIEKYSNKFKEIFKILLIFISEIDQVNNLYDMNYNFITIMFYIF